MNNYDLEFLKITESLTEKKRLALQACCAPCLSSVLERVLPFFDVTVFFTNSNINSFEEFLLRLNELDKLKKAGFVFEIEVDKYEHTEFLEVVKGLENEREGGARCGLCYDYRLNKTAEFAKKIDADFFATTLTVSPHKNAELINKIGFAISDKYGVKFLPSDFKKRDGYKRSVELSKKYGIYRQAFCGCNWLF